MDDALRAKTAAACYMWLAKLDAQTERQTANLCSSKSVESEASQGSPSPVVQSQPFVGGSTGPQPKNDIKRKRRFRPNSSPS